MNSAGQKLIRFGQGAPQQEEKWDDREADQ